MKKLLTIILLTTLLASCASKQKCAGLARVETQMN